MRAPTAVLAGRHRVVAALAGAGLVVGCAPAFAAPRADPDEAVALELLSDAAEASRSLTYSGTQYVATWGPAETSALLDVEHAPGRGAQVRPSADRGDVVEMATGDLALELLDALSERYVLRLAGEGHCTGRAAHVVEALRPGAPPSATSAVAGRFWVDQDTGLLLRREVFDDEGRRLRSSAFLDLAVSAPDPAPPPASVRRSAARSPGRPGTPVPAWSLGRLREDGHVAPEALPGGFVLFDARARGASPVRPGDADVLHLSYSDGLSTTSLFSQPGELGTAPPRGFARRTVAGAPVWASTTAPERMVWAGGGRVWTLVSDAPPDAVDAAVAALPHDALPETDTGWRARLARGAARLADALNPFS